MRPLAVFLLCAIAGRAQPEAQVQAVYKQMEHAEQTGDADTWISLWSRASASDAKKMRPLIRPRPDAHYMSSKIFTQGDDAVLLGQFAPGQFLSMRFVREDGHWKIKDQAFSNKPYPAESVYALIPPPPGAFDRAGSPWQNVPPAFNPAEAARKGFQVRSTYDESFLYIRIESPAPMPAPGTPAETPPMGWPVMKVAVSGVGEFVVHASANIGSDSHRHYVAYWLMLERANQMIFQTWAGLNPDPLVQAGDHFFTVRIPLRTMGVANATQITIADAQWPKSALFSLAVPQYR